MRVLLVTEKKVLSFAGHFYTDGGSPKEFAALATRFHLEVLTPVFPAASFPNHLEQIDDGVVIHSLGPVGYFSSLPPILIMLKCVYRTFRLCLSRHFDVVIAKGPREIGMVAVIAARLARTSVLYHHSLDWLTYPPIRSTGLTRLIRLLYEKCFLSYRHLFTRFILHLANMVATVSPQFQHQLVARLGIQESKTVLLPNSFTLRDELFTLPIDTDRRSHTILYIGRIDANKNVPMILHAVKRLLGLSVKDYQIIIIGDGPERCLCEQIVSQLGVSDKISFTGYVPNAQITPYLADAIFLILPSFSEGLSQVIIEAMASGCPVIASDRGGTPSLVQDGINGFLIDPHDLDSLVQKMLILIRDKNLRTSMAYAARATAETYRSDSILQRWTSVMEAMRRNRQ